MAVDLDGTLIRGNSLHLYIRCGLAETLKRGHLWRVARIATALAMRKAGLWSHLTMKRAVLKTIRPDERLMREFVSRFKTMLSPTVTELIAHARDDGMSVLLATAAPETYVSWVWAGDFVATDALSRCECRGDEKRRRVLEYASRHGLTLRSVVTDHYDDKPLLEVESVEARYLISPSAKTLAQLDGLPLKVCE